MQFGRRVPSFQVNLLVPPKRFFLPTKLHGVTSHKVKLSSAYLMKHYSMKMYGAMDV
jgi:hypothetical protein